MKTQRLAYALGAEITGCDFSRPPDPAHVAEIRTAWLENVVLCFRGQDLDPEGLHAFAACFGDVDDNRNAYHLQLPGKPTVGLLSSKPVEVAGKSFKRSVADLWHSDLSYTQNPSTATILHAKALPETGGNTMFANMYAAYDALSDGMKATIAQLEGVHDFRLSGGFELRTPEEQATIFAANPPIARPVVLVHPETGRKALHVGARLTHFEGMTAEESKPIIDFLNEHATRYEFVYRHVWQPGDLLMWDNRCAMHYAVQDYDRGALRRMIRCSLLGPKSGHVVAAV